MNIKTVNAVDGSGEISINKLEPVLQSKFNFSQREYNDFSDEHYVIPQPVNREIEHTEIWDFMGLQLVFNDQKEFRAVDIYKL